MGINIDEPQFVFGDNQSMLANTSSPHLTSNKKYSSIEFHFVCEVVASN